MSPLVHRWFNGSRSRWMLGVLLGVALVGAQTLAGRHELSHLFDSASARDATTVAAGRLDVPSARAAGLHANAPAVQGEPRAPTSHDCPLCLMAAALGGTTVAPQGLAFAAVEAPLVRTATSSTPCVARTLRVYASRAPPLA